MGFLKAYSIPSFAWAVVSPSIVIIAALPACAKEVSDTPISEWRVEAIDSQLAQKAVEYAVKYIAPGETSQEWTRQAMELVYRHPADHAQRLSVEQVIKTYTDRIESCEGERRTEFETIETGEYTIIFRQMYCPKVPAISAPMSLMISGWNLPEGFRLKAVLHRYDPGPRDVEHAKKFLLSTSPKVAKQ